MNGSLSFISWILMSLGTSLIVLTISVSRIRRSFPSERRRVFFNGIHGEPRLGLYMLVSFAAGLLGVFAAGFGFIVFEYFQLIRHPVFSAVFEEGVKFLLLALVISRPLSKALNHIDQTRVLSYAIGVAAVYGMTLGIGFGLGESILYALDDPNILLLRGVSSIVLHALTGAMAGRFAGTRVLGKPCWRCPFVATGLHLLYNFLIGLAFPYNYAVFLVLFAVTVVVMHMFGGNTADETR